MKNKSYKILVFIFYLVSLFLLILSFKDSICNIDLSIYIRLTLILFAYLLIYISGFILVKKLNYTNTILKINLILYFIIYIMFILYLTLFDQLFGRNGITLVNWNSELFSTYLKYSFNIIPFRTIKLFINGYINEYINFRNFAINIYGNLFAFMPCGLFIPLIFNKKMNYYKFLIIMIIFIIVIEFLQFITLSGSCDIDDLILNVMGASFVYFIYKIKCVRNLVNKIFVYGGDK